MRKWVILVFFLVLIILGWFWYHKQPSPLPSSIQVIVTASGTAPLGWISPSSFEVLHPTWKSDISSWGGRSFWSGEALQKEVTELQDIIQLFEHDASGKANKLFQQKLFTWREQLSTNDIPRHIARISYWMLKDIDDQHPAYRIKQTMEDMRYEWESDPSTQLAWRMLALSSRLDEAAAAIANQRLEEAGVATSAGLQGLQNIAFDMGQLKSQWSSEQSEAYGQAWSRLQTRTVLLKEQITRLEQQVDPQVAIDLVTSTAVVMTPTTTVDVIATTTLIDIATSTAPEVRRVSIIPSSQALSFGESLTLRAYAIYDDSTRKDITSSCQFAVAPPGFGIIEKQRFSALANAGNALITGTCKEQEKTITGSVTIQVAF